jgi:hypothetical protein
MTQRAVGRIELGPDDALPDLLVRVKATRGDDAVIVIPESSNILLTATEFRTLKATADQVRVGITFETNDKLRTQLAGMFGFSHAPLLNGDEQTIIEEHPSWPTPDSRLAPSRVTVPTGDLTTSKPWRVEPIDASSGISVPPKPIPRPEFAMEPRTGAIAKQEPEARAKTKPTTIIGIAIGIVAVLSVAAVLSIVLRTAEITVRTPRQPVGMELNVGYSVDGSRVPGMPITIPAESTQFTVPYQLQVPSTGVTDNQGGKAAGSVELRNISGKSVTMPAGTRLTLADGTIYVTSSDATIPKGDAEKPGKSTVAIQAENPGAVANRDAGKLTGQVTDHPGVYFGNIGAPLAGGTDVVIKLVTDRDLETARQQAITDLQQQAATYQLPDGRVVIPSTIQPLGDITVDADHVAGDQADVVNISAQGEFQALTINPDDLPEQVQTDIRNQLAVNVPAGYLLTRDPIKFANPREASPGSGTITVDVSIDAAQQLTPAQIGEIRSATKGKSQDDARAALANVEGIELVDLSVSPSLLVNSMPGAGKIDVVTQ